MVTRTCETKRGVEVEIGSRRETVSDRLDPFWTGPADNLVPTKTADFPLGARGIPGNRRALALLAGSWYENRGEYRAPPRNAGRARRVHSFSGPYCCSLRAWARLRSPLSGPERSPFSTQRMKALGPKP